MKKKNLFLLLTILSLFIILAGQDTSNSKVDSLSSDSSSINNNSSILSEDEYLIKTLRRFDSIFSYQLVLLFAGLSFTGARLMLGEERRIRDKHPAEGIEVKLMPICRAKKGYNKAFYLYAFGVVYYLLFDPLSVIEDNITYYNLIEVLISIIIFLVGFYYFLQASRNVLKSKIWV